MKTNLLKISLFAAFMTFSSGCKEEKFLNEVPLDFYSPENSYVNEAHFESALVDLYARVRSETSVTAGANEYTDVLGTDVAFNSRLDNNRLADYNNTITPQNNVPKIHWVNYYKIISNANTILSRLPDSQVPEEKRAIIAGEAKLFRAWAYRYLVHIYGGVPLILEEATSPKSDFVRATRDEIFSQVISDATEAANILPNVAVVANGRLNKSVANHILAETYLTLKQYDQAIAAATEVIEKSSLALMTARFGSLKDKPGDVYYDLFRVGNQNRSAGNTEAIWVAQYEVDIPGGGLTSAGSATNQLERVVAPVAFTLKDPKGAAVVLGNLPASTLNVGGRGASFVQPTDYYLYDIWGLDPKADNRVIKSTDIRTSAYNIVRDFIYTNPASQYFGKSMIDFPTSQWVQQSWRWYPYPSKVTTPGQHPLGLMEDPVAMTLKATAGATYRDMYLIRLPETYFLRAEAYFMKGDLAKAAADLNVVRARSNATLIQPGQVSLDFILDERARELIFEENRRLVLVRMGKLVERVRKYNPLNKGNINDHNILFPIPYSEIEANKDAKLEQNPGY
ncbi:RagB/SusD family nutrient uptake outer membrane protein [Dyadobacter sp. CY323]|uniref:RagB/SusD family nutrient uptake outer membrane protein n=1 Tax=Dyadobacter sp. CY323 TaxID=2907302 RepID=UPI001F2B5A56|nr:RagB/SusD family nutrient uptake outer membrane protein [Dyadobacter sp. CY323]MCE6991214.1 RagB/SusD family nutrient uptake outer membrane protein [Dyadobacter sp. CY323]